ncbi:hypothetical protein IWQ62_003417 [Dispira parvispora]|uniref:Uncharacterized protein n=1 Tax=Dispira parvispora TaxID=1520584 RepID=A0A9W8E2X8_9FUNG|nr:hypothetical protein IWQ62_003417 [Dispira parvispora]
MTVLVMLLMCVLLISGIRAFPSEFAEQQRDYGNIIAYSHSNQSPVQDPTFNADYNKEIDQAKQRSAKDQCQRHTDITDSTVQQCSYASTSPPSPTSLYPRSSEQPKSTGEVSQSITDNEIQNTTRNPDTNDKPTKKIDVDAKMDAQKSLLLRVYQLPGNEADWERARNTLNTYRHLRPSAFDDLHPYMEIQRLALKYANALIFQEAPSYGNVDKILFPMLEEADIPTANAKAFAAKGYKKMDDVMSKWWNLTEFRDAINDQYTTFFGVAAVEDCWTVIFV